MSSHPFHDMLMRPLIPRLIEAIGVEATIRLLEERGGAILWLPTSGEHSSVLVDLIGKDAAVKLVAAFQGYDRLSLPMPDKLLSRTRNLQILSDLARGDTERAVARRYRLTVRQVQNVRRDGRRAQNEPSPQTNLF